MKNDIDALMQAENLDALLVTGGLMHNPAMVYWTGIANVLRADLIKIRGKEPVLFHSVIERDEARRTGLETICYSKYDWNAMLEEAGGDLHKARALQFQSMFNDVGLTEGMRVGIYGKVELHSFLADLEQLKNQLPAIIWVFNSDVDVIQKAKETKDTVEIERIRSVGQRALKIVDEIKNYLASRQVKGEIVLDECGNPLTIGQVHARINRLVSECGLETPEGFIFAIGRDAGFPHNAGNPDDVIKLGKTIVYDFYPCERGGGYFYDFTRTWCLGYADSETIDVYNSVKNVYYQMLDDVRINAHFYDFQTQACRLFEERGFPTVLSTPGTGNGYIHGLGHGIGLNIHETPLCRASFGEDDVIKPNAVITIEPGLYFPDKEMGVRIENSFLITESGQLEELVSYPDDLIVPMKA